MKNGIPKFLLLCVMLAITASVPAGLAFSQGAGPVYNIIWSPANAGEASSMGQLYVSNYVRGIDAVIGNATLSGDNLYFDVRQLAFTDSSDATTLYDLSGSPYQGNYTLNNNNVRVALGDVRQANVTTGQLENVSMDTGNGTFVHLETIMQGQDPAAASFQVSGMNLVFPDGRAISYAFTKPINAVYDKNGRLILMNVPSLFARETRDEMSKCPSQAGGPVSIALLREKAASGERKIVA